MDTKFQRHGPANARGAGPRSPPAQGGSDRPADTRCATGRLRSAAWRWGGCAGLGAAGKGAQAHSLRAGGVVDRFSARREETRPGTECSSRSRHPVDTDGKGSLPYARTRARLELAEVPGMAGGYSGSLTAESGVAFPHPKFVHDSGRCAVGRPSTDSAVLFQGHRSEHFFHLRSDHCHFFRKPREEFGSCQFRAADTRSATVDVMDSHALKPRKITQRRLDRFSEDVWGMGCHQASYLGTYQL